MLALWKDVYVTYRGDSERHWLRCVGGVIVSIFIAMFGAGSASVAFNVMSLSLSVLAGFTFTALFSDHAVTTHGLPSAKSEDDRRDISQLVKMGKNFRIRANFFIAVSIFDLLLMLIASISLSFDDLCASEFLGSKCNMNFDRFHLWVDGFFSSAGISFFFGVVVRFLVFFLFIECLYTFYRLTETIMAIVDTRRKYLEARSR